MYRLRSFACALILTLTVTVMVSASASASVYLVETMEALIGEEFETLSEQSSNAVLRSVGANVEVVCNTTKDEGTIGPGGKSTTRVSFTGCAVNKPNATCKVVEPIKVEATDQLVLVGGRILDEFKPKMGNRFVQLKFLTCVLEEIEVEGTARAFITPENELRLKLKFSFSATSGSNLTVGGNAASFTLTEDVWLENDDNWGVR